MKLLFPEVPDMTFIPPAQFALKVAMGIAFLKVDEATKLISLILFRTEEGELRFFGGTADPLNSTSALMQSLAWCKAKGINVDPNGMLFYQEIHRLWSKVEWQGANTDHGAYTSSDLPPSMVANYETHGVMPAIYMEGPAERLAHVWVDKAEGETLTLDCDHGEDIYFVNKGVATIVRFMLAELYHARRENRRPNAYQHAINGYPFQGGPERLNKRV
jgi:hypothetical protein